MILKTKESNEKLLKKRNGEKGIIGIVFSSVLAIVMSTVVAQIVLNQQSQNSSHAGNRNQIIQQQKLTVLALRFQEALNQARVNPGCPTGTENISLNGVGFCIPTSGEFCTNLTRVVNGRETREEVCTSIRPADISWNDANAGNGNLDVTSVSPVTTGLRNRIRVPATTSPLWQSCAGAGNNCIRILLCADGVRACTFNQALAYQVIKL